MKPSRNVRTKIALGYALIIVVSILSVGYVYRQVERFTEPDDSRVQVQTRRSLVNQTLYHLYQAEGYGQFLIAGYPSYERRYRDELRVVREHLDSLGQWGAGGSDSLQRIRLDSISSLIDVKERSTLGLQRTIRSAGTATLLNKNIRQLLPPDSVRADSAARTVVRQDTVTVPRRKRGFFRRLGDVFRPPKEDSSVVISTRVIVDSLPAAAVSDTIAGVLRNLQDRVTSERLELYERALNAANAAASHDSASEHPASGQGRSTFLSGESTLAVSAMKCTPAKRMISASDCRASTARASESPRKSATCCTSGRV